MATKKVTKKLVSPARQLSQGISDLGQQKLGAEYRGIPEFVPGDARTAGPAPTLYNANTGEWYEVTPFEARMHNIPLGPPSMDVLNKMFMPGQPRTHSPVETGDFGDKVT
jgi:hypothetical protein